MLVRTLHDGTRPTREVVPVTYPVESRGHDPAAYIALTTPRHLRAGVWLQRRSLPDALHRSDRVSLAKTSLGGASLVSARSAGALATVTNAIQPWRHLGPAFVAAASPWLHGPRVRLQRSRIAQGHHLLNGFCVREFRRHVIKIIRGSSRIALAGSVALSATSTAGLLPVVCGPQRIGADPCARGLGGPSAWIPLRRSVLGYTTGVRAMPPG